MDIIDRVMFMYRDMAPGKTRPRNKRLRHNGISLKTSAFASCIHCTLTFLPFSKKRHLVVKRIVVLKTVRIFTLKRIMFPIINFPFPIPQPLRNIRKRPRLLSLTPFVYITSIINGSLTLTSLKHVTARFTGPFTAL